jgi:hypothetical protein
VLAALLAAAGVWFVVPSNVNLDFQVDGFGRYTEGSSGRVSRCAHVRVANNAARAIWYWGCPARPDFSVCTLADGRWRGCSNSSSASQWTALPGHGSIEFDVPFNEGAAAIRVGLAARGSCFFGAGDTYWSGAIGVAAP